MTEFELIDLFTAGAERRGEGVVVGIGDDAAVLRAPRGEDLVMTVDSVVEDVHFDRRFPPADIGWKALAVNLSDLAAMGARPLWALCALGVPPGESGRRLAGIGRGLAACARNFGTVLVGGNVTRARDLSLTVTVVGAVKRGAAITRSGARPGDVLLVSGTIGDAALGIRRPRIRAFAGRQRRPVPRIALGRALAGIASAGLDLSDGLVQDLGHVCEESGVGARIRLDALPLSAAYRRWMRGQRRPYDPALAGGEDYELLVAVPPRKVARAIAAARRAGSTLTEIGEVTRGAGILVGDEEGQPYRLSARGHDHLRRPTAAS